MRETGEKRSSQERLGGSTQESSYARGGGSTCAHTDGERGREGRRKDSRKQDCSNTQGVSASKTLLMQLTIAAVEELSAPPERGSSYTQGVVAAPARVSKQERSYARAWCQHLRASASTAESPASIAESTMPHMQPTMAAVEELSAPPDRGSRNPDAPDRRR